MTPSDAGEKDGQVRNEVTIAAVTVDADGKIADCKIDAYRTDIKFNTKGELTNTDAEIITKNAMGEAYGMSAIAPKGEWNVQAAGFAAYCVGKTLDEIKGILRRRFDAIDFDQAREDVLPFIKNPSAMDVWSRDFFVAITEGLTAQ